MSLEIKPAYSDIESIITLFSEYINLLTNLESDFQSYLNLQNYDSEIYNLNEKYGLPYGRLYIAYSDNQAAGCIALRQINEMECEMKRLYVRPQFRGNGIASDLVKLIIDEAKKAGYQYMLLDALPALKAAISLYESFGFYRTPPYNNSPVSNTVFMRLDLFSK